jgi:tetratricopeptide (TPR) repeat protein
MFGGIAGALGTFALGAAACLASPASAQSAASAEQHAEAKQRFDRGLLLFDEGNSEAALTEFKRAFELVPNQVVLFNIGLTYADMKRPVDALDALVAVLEAPRALSAAQLELARRTRDDQLRRVGYVTVVTNVPASIAVDSVQVGQTPLSAALRLAQGIHVIGASAPDRLTLSHELTIAGGERDSLQLELELASTAAAQLSVRSRLRDVSISIDGKLAGKTPFATSISLEPGRHSVSASRLGYVSEQREIDVPLGGRAELAFALHEDRGAPGETHGELKLTLGDEPGADLTIDQEAHGPYLRPLSLPIGPHVLRVTREGFEPLEREIVIGTQQPSELELQLTATAETRTAHRDAVTTQRTWGWVAALSGAGIAAAGLVVGLTAQAGLSDARSTYDALLPLFELKSGRECDTRSVTPQQYASSQCDARIQAAKDEVDHHTLWRNIGFAAAGVGAAIAITGSVLLLTAGDPDKYERSARAQWLIGPGSAGVRWSL